MIDVTERRIPGMIRGEFSQAAKRRDLFGFIDLVALTPEGILGIQSTAYGDIGARKAKICAACTTEAVAWLRAGGLIEIWGWRKYSTPIARKYWRPTIVPIGLSDLIHSRS